MKMSKKPRIVPGGTVHILLLFAGIVACVFIVYCLAVPIQNGVQKRHQRKLSRPQATAVARAKAEHRCDDVKPLTSEGGFEKLQVCGTVRWYRC